LCPVFPLVIFPQNRKSKHNEFASLFVFSFRSSIEARKVEKREEEVEVEVEVEVEKGKKRRRVIFFHFFFLSWTPRARDLEKKNPLPAMASTTAAELVLVSLLAAVVPVALFVLLHKTEASKGPALLFAALRWKQHQQRHRLRRSSATRHSMLTRVAPSEHGFLPAKVPDFRFDNDVLDGFVKVRNKGN